RRARGAPRARRVRSAEGSRCAAATTSAATTTSAAAAAPRRLSDAMISARTAAWRPRASAAPGLPAPWERSRRLVRDRGLIWPTPGTWARPAPRVAFQRLLPVALRPACRGRCGRAGRAALRGARPRVLPLERRHLSRVRARLPGRQGGARRPGRHAHRSVRARAGGLDGLRGGARTLRRVPVARVELLARALVFGRASAWVACAHRQRAALPGRAMARPPPPSLPPRFPPARPPARPAPAP